MTKASTARHTTWCHRRRDGQLTRQARRHWDRVIRTGRTFPRPRCVCEARLLIESLTHLEESRRWA